MERICIYHCNIHTVSGPDRLNARVFFFFFFSRNVALRSHKILILIFNESLTSNSVPDEWREANVAPKKKKKKKKKKNYLRAGGWGVGGGEVFKLVLLRETSPFILTQLQLTIIRLVHIGTLTLICVTSQGNIYNR